MGIFSNFGKKPPKKAAKKKARKKTTATSKPKGPGVSARGVPGTIRRGKARRDKAMKDAGA